MDDVLENCLRGRKWAWDAFVDRYAGVIFAAVGRVLGRGRDRTEEAEDVAQDVFVRLVRNDFALLRRYDPDRSSITTWLTIVSRSVAIDHLRRRRLQAVSLDDAPPTTAPPEPQTPSTPTAEHPMELLTARQKLVLQLIYDRDMDPEAVGRVLGISAQTVRSTKHKALQRLREYYEKEGPP
ncbi:MAG TPA: sigma-70 family RNA polymerase sigma factor [Phycisphaerae bacterium]|nr:sigma-70 family RNA polymerase sigma factor [Phycisphaerae bacterium]